MELQYFDCAVGAGVQKEFLFPTLRICQILSGSFTWQIGANIYTFAPGDIVLLNNLNPRKILSSHEVPLHIAVFEFSPMEIQRRPLLVQAFYSENAPIIPAENADLLRSLLSAISRAYNTVKSPAFYEHTMQAVFDLLENTFCHLSPCESSTSTAFAAARYIWDHLTEDLNVPAIAKHFHVSKNHLEKLFKQVHGIGVGAYIRTVRVHQVISLLSADPNRSVLDIALSCGFNSSSGFYKAYKAITDMNPRRA